MPPRELLIFPLIGGWSGALALLSVTGVLLWAALSGLSWLLLYRWHESAVRREV